MGVEARDRLEVSRHIGGGVERRDRARSEHRLQAREGLVVHRRLLRLLGIEHRRRRTAGDAAEQLTFESAAELEELHVRHTERHFVDAGLHDVAADREQLRAGALVGAEGAVALGAVLEDVRHRHDGFDVVDHRRRGKGAADRREGRLEARLALEAFERIDESGLFAADVGASAAVDVDVERVVGAADVLAEQTGRVGLLDGVVERADLRQHLTTHIDVRGAHAERVTGDDHALEQQVRIARHAQAVLEGARLALVGVDHQVHRLAGVARHKGPLHASGKARAAAAAQAGILDQLDQLELALVEEHRPDGAVSAVLLRHGEGVAVLDLEQAAEDARQVLALPLRRLRETVERGHGQAFAGAGAAGAGGAGGLPVAEMIALGRATRSFSWAITRYCAVTPSGSLSATF